MTSERRRHLITIGVAAALVAMLGAGTVEAAKQVTSSQIKNGTIQNEDIKEGTITSSRIKDGTLQGADIKNGTIGANDLSTAAKDSLKTTYAGPNWSIVDRNVTGNGASLLRAGPSAGNDVPPYGIGSLGIRAAAGDKSAFGNQVDFIGDPLSAITTVKYSIYTTGENNNQNVDNLPSAAFEIDPTGIASTSTPNFSTLVFVATNAGSNTWTLIDASTATRWFLTGAAGTTANCTLANMCTLAQVKAAWPAAEILTAQITKGTDAFNFSGAVDGLQINDVVFDFEPFGVSQTTPAP